MLRESYARALKELEEEMIQLGNMVIQAISRSIETLKNLDVDDARAIVEDDIYINQKRWQIEDRCIDLMATQQPVASELRRLIAILNIISELERMGDHAGGIAKIVIQNDRKPWVKPLVDIPRMGDMITQMIRDALQAFVKRDEELARRISAQDDDIDLITHQIYRELLTYMAEDPKTITSATYLIWVSHNLERIADRVTNICERTVYLITGQIEDLNVSVVKKSPWGEKEGDE
ncbi:MAG: phosphate signaling complex protein PhoU [bacterium]